MRLRHEIDDWMAQYDERQEEKKRLAKETQVDDDGFTKVVSGITRTPDGLTIRGARRPSLKTGAFGESTENTVVPAGKKMKSKKSKEMPDFYRFQLREKRRDELIDHRKRNRKDMETVKQMKKAQQTCGIIWQSYTTTSCVKQVHSLSLSLFLSLSLSLSPSLPPSLPIVLSVSLGLNLRGQTLQSDVSLRRQTKVRFLGHWACDGCAYSFAFCKRHRGVRLQRVQATQAASQGYLQHLRC